MGRRSFRITMWMRPRPPALSRRTRGKRSGPRRPPPSSWIGNAALLSVSIAVALLLAELGLRAIPGVYGTERWPIITRYDSLLGWTLVPDTTATIRTREFEVTVRVNAAGFRGPPLPARKSGGERWILLLGDSFTEGYTVDQGETVADVLQRELGDGTRVVNAGTRGWSTDQQLLFFLRRGRDLEPDVTFVLFFMNDVCHNAVDRTWRGNKPRYAMTGDGIALRGVPVPPPVPAQETAPPGWREAVAEALGTRSAVFQVARRALGRLRERRPAGPMPLPWAPWAKSPDEHPCLPEGWEMTERLLVELREQVERLGGRLGVFWVPSREAVYEDAWERIVRSYGLDPDRWSPTSDGKRLGEVCRRRRLTCTLPLEAFRRSAGEGDERLYFRGDGHWTAAGHELAGKLLAEAIRERFPAPGPRARDSR